jgi:hypothetical protein
MMISVERTVRRRGLGRARARTVLVSLIAVGAFALASTASAGAAVTVTGTAAPIGTSAILLTVTNTGSEPLTQLIFTAGETPTPSNFAPSTCAFGNTPVVASITCNVNVAPGATTQICYTGNAPFELVPGDFFLTNGSIVGGTVTTAPAVGSCPVAGFKGAGSSGGSTSKCKVPNVKGKTLAAAEKALTKAHCAVGKIKKTKSSKVKKGSVVSQGAAAGKSLSKGSKVSLIVSR